jgi:hypothetical protein
LVFILGVLFIVVSYYKLFGQVVFAAEPENIKDIVKEASDKVKDLKPEIKGDINNTINVDNLSLSGDLKVPTEGLSGLGRNGLMGTFGSIGYLALKKSPPSTKILGAIGTATVIGAISVGIYTLDTLTNKNLSKNGENNIGVNGVIDNSNVTSNNINDSVNNSNNINKMDLVDINDLINNYDIIDIKYIDYINNLFYIIKYLV